MNTGSIANQILHSSVGGAIQTGNIAGLSSQGVSTTTGVYKTNTLDQYGGVGAGRNSALNNINAIVNSSMVGGPNFAQGVAIHHQRNNTQNQTANIVRGMAGINLNNYSILQSELD